MEDSKTPSENQTQNTTKSERKTSSQSETQNTSTSQQQTSQPPKKPPKVSSLSTSPPPFVPRYHPNNPSQQPPNTPDGPYIVTVHIQPNAEFTVQVGEETQTIQGPATVRMKSDNPPEPLELSQHPDFHIQQVVNKGILTQIFISPNQHISPMRGAQNPPMYMNNHGCFHHPPPPPPPPPPPLLPNNNNSSMDQRKLKRIHRLQNKLQQRKLPSDDYEQASHFHPPSPRFHIHQYQPIHHHPHHHHPPPIFHSISPTHFNEEYVVNKTTVNINDVRDYNNNTNIFCNENNNKNNNNKNNENNNKNNDNINNKNNENNNNNNNNNKMTNGEIKNCHQRLRRILSRLEEPQFTNLEARSVRVRVSVMKNKNNNKNNEKNNKIDKENNKNEEEEDGWLEDEDVGRVKCLMFLSKDRDESDNYSLVDTDKSLEVLLEGLTPATTYYIKFRCYLDDVTGDMGRSYSFSTPPCAPSQPAWPKLVSKNKFSILLKWNAPQDNGCKILHYILECDQGKDTFIETYRGPQKQYKVSKLEPSVSYAFRLCAQNAVGVSEWSEVVSYRTSDKPPQQPSPPSILTTTPHSISLTWIRRPDDVTFTLQMEDQSSGHGFWTIYDGSDVAYTVNKLKRVATYKFRLQSSNDKGSSNWSDVITAETRPQTPQPPLKLKFKTFPQSFKLYWDEPKDNGGSVITHYTICVRKEGGDFETYTDRHTEREAIIEGLSPGSSYDVKVASVNSVGVSETSCSLRVTTSSIHPCTCDPPVLNAHGLHPYYLVLQWDSPPSDGGSPITEYHLLIINPDSSQRVAYKGPHPTCTVAGLNPSTTYQFKVRAANKNGTSDWSSPSLITTSSCPPDPPHAPHITSSSSSSSLSPPPLSSSQPPSLSSLPPSLSLSPTTTTTTFSTTQPATQHTPTTSDVVIDPSTDPPSHPSPNTCHAPPSNTFHTPPSNTCHAPPSYICHPSPTCTHLISWDAPPDNGSAIIEYVVEYKEEGEEGMGDQEFQKLCTTTETSAVTSKLKPHTRHLIRIIAVNENGPSEASQPAVFMTPPSVPQPITDVIVTSKTANSITLSWKPPHHNGSSITGYSIEVVGVKLVDVGVREEEGRVVGVVEGLISDTTYKLRVHASNSCGCGGNTGVVVKATTHPLPPSPPTLEVASCSSKLLKLRWSESKKNDSLLYTLEMSKKGEEYSVIYQGPNKQHKTTKITEMTSYNLRIRATNQTGVGPFSTPLTITTPISPPPPVKAPTIADLDTTSCLISWPIIRLPGDDVIHYVLQLADSNTPFRTVYEGQRSNFRLEKLHEDTEYQVRVCGVRVRGGDEQIVGPYSPKTTFTTHLIIIKTPSSSSSSSPSSSHQSTSATEMMRRTTTRLKCFLLDNVAVLMMLLFAMVAVSLAFLARNLIDHHPQQKFPFPPNKPR